ncbi:MAG: hypothetical protein JKY16_04650 [Lutibacter sp.]|nr:hypothetical protein [Lutibacter sp.]
MKIKYVVVGFFLIFLLKAQSQTNLITKKGHLKLFVRIDGQLVTAESQKLSVHLDYTNKVMNGTLDLKSLKSEVPELNTFLNSSDQPLQVYFSGVIPRDDFMSQPHEPLVFNWLVNVTFQNTNFDIVLRTTLEHIEEGSLFSCRLAAMGSIKAAQVNLNELIPNITETIEIQFIQFILKT